MKKIPNKQIQLVFTDDSKRKSLIQIQSDELSPKKKGERKGKKQHEHQDIGKTQREELQNNVQASSEIHQQKENKKKKKEKEKDKKFSWPIWKKLMQYTLKRKIHAAIALILSITFAMSLSLLPLKIGKVLDYITLTSGEDTVKNTDQLKASLEQLSILIGILAVAGYFRFLSLQFLQQFIAIDMKTQFYRIFMSKDLYFFEQYKSGQLVSRLSTDVNQAKSAVSNNVTMLIRNLILVLSNIIILYTISWQLAFVIMIIVPIYAIITRQYSRFNKVLVRQYQDVQAEVSAAVAQKFSGIQLVKAYSTQQKQIDGYAQKIMKGYYIQRKKLLVSGLYSSISQFLPYIGILIVLWLGGQMVIQHNSQITAGDLTTFIMYCSSLANSTSSISNSYTNIINGTFAVQKVFQMLDYKPQVDESKGSEINISGDIQFDNVTFKYPSSKTPVIKNLSLKIKKGEYIAFVGQSGSGKSTIIKIIEKFYKIQSGNIYFGMHNQEDIKANHLRRQIGLVNQQATMFSGTIRQNITYGLNDYNIQDIEASAERAGCMQFLKDKTRFPQGFQSTIGQRGCNVSGGQKQRISIARALMRRPKIIIFDQATSALDSNSQQMVQTSIQNLALKHVEDKPTIIVIAHRLSTVMNTDRIVVMKNGQIIEMGNHNYLKSLKGYYYQLIQKQLGQNPQLIQQ